MKESAFWSIVRGKLPGYKLRIENGVAPGTPDTWWEDVTGARAWLELKSLTTWCGALGVRREQRAWMRHYYKARAPSPVYVLARLPGGDILLVCGWDVVNVKNASEPEWRTLAELVLDQKDKGKWEKLIHKLRSTAG